MNRIIEIFRAGKPSGVSNVIRATNGGLVSWTENGFSVSVVRSFADRTLVLSIKKGFNLYSETMRFNSYGDYLGSDNDQIPTDLGFELRNYGLAGVNTDVANAMVFSPELTDDELNGLADATSKFLAAAQRLRDAGKGVFRVIGTPIVRNSILLPADTDIIFVPGSHVKTAAGGSYTANGLFLINTTNGTGWDTPYPGIRSSARNVRVVNSADPSNVVGAMIIGAPIYIENINVSHGHFSVKGTSNYLDQVRINGAMAAEQQGSNYAIELSNLGDGLSIKAAHAYISGGLITPKNVRLNACQGGEIQGSIGGDIYFSQCRAVKMHGGHHETGVITIDGSDVSIDDTMLWVGTLPGIKEVSNPGGERRTVNLRNVTWVYRREITTATTAFDLQVGTGYHTTIENCSRCYGSNGTAYNSEKFGIFVANSAGTALTEWNNYSYALSRRGEIDTNQKVSSLFSVNTGSGTPALFNGSGLATTSVWQAAGGTYYYQAQLIYDGGRRLGVNSSSAELFFTVTNGGNCPYFVVGPGFGSRTQNCFLRLYRGTAANTYDSYVDLPLLSARQIVDRGDTCCGFAWISRTATVVATLFETTAFQHRGSTVKCTIATIPPSGVGTWVVGDDCYAATPTASGNRASTCVTAGTPGTHKTWGAISA